jgi:chaperonin GroES
MSLDLVLYQDQVLVRRFDTEKVTACGVVIPDTAQTPPQMGEVVAVGNGFWDEISYRPLDVQPGDDVLFEYGAGMDIRLNGKPYLLLSESKILMHRQNEPRPRSDDNRSS